MESASTSRTGSGRGRMGVPSLEDITCSQLARKLRDPKSVLFGEELPGVLNANLPEDDELRKKVWRMAASLSSGDEDTAIWLTTIPRARPFFGSSFITDLVICGLSDVQARELSVPPISLV